MIRSLFRLLALVAAAASASIYASPAAWVPGEAAITPKAQAVARLHLQGQAKAVHARIELTPPDAADMAAIRARSHAAQAKHVPIGLTRELHGPARAHGSDWAWSAVDGGAAAQASITSSGAAAVRMSIALAGVPADVQMVFFGSDDPS